MKQTKLVVRVNPVDGVNQTFDPATIDNVRSCIDLYHLPGTKIELSFEEFEVSSSNN